MKSTPTIIARIATVTGLALGAFAISALAANWTPPPEGPPNCHDTTPGCLAPINVGSAVNQMYEQTKNDWLRILGGLNTTNLYVANEATLSNSVFIPTVNGNKKVLTSDDTGHATWQTPSAVPPSGMNMIFLDSKGTLLNTGDVALIDWTTLNVSSYVPADAKVAIIEYALEGGNFLYADVRKDGTSPILRINKGREKIGGQAFVPLTAAKTFQYYAEPDTGSRITNGSIYVIGYIK